MLEGDWLGLDVAGWGRHGGGGTLAVRTGL